MTTPNDPRPEVTDEDARRLIDEVFGILPDLSPWRLETPIGPAIQITVEEPLMGGIVLTYPLMQAARNLLGFYGSAPETARAGARAVLGKLIGDLPLAVQIGIENAFDASHIWMVNRRITSVEVAKDVPGEGTKARKKRLKDVKEQERKTRAVLVGRMSKRNERLLNEVTRGKVGVVDKDTVSAAVVWHSLVYPTQEVSEERLCDRLGVKWGSVNRFFNRQGTNLKDFVRGWYELGLRRPDN